MLCIHKQIKIHNAKTAENSRKIHTKHVSKRRPSTVDHIRQCIFKLLSSSPRESAREKTNYTNEIRPKNANPMRANFER